MKRFYIFICYKISYLYWLWNYPGYKLGNPYMDRTSKDIILKRYLDKKPKRKLESRL